MSHPSLPPTSTAGLAPFATPPWLGGDAFAAPLLFVPGLSDSGPAHWQSHWQAQLRGSRRVSQRDWQTPDLAAWTDTLSRVIAAAASPPIVIAHSFGALATVAAGLAGANILAALLVAPADGERLGVDEYLPRRHLPFATTLVASTNDPCLKLVRAGELASVWGSRFVPYRNAGHLNAESGFGPWPEGLQLVQELVERASEQYRAGRRLRTPGPI